MEKRSHRTTLFSRHLKSRQSLNPQPPREGRFVEASLEDLERRHILETLDALDWNKTKTAQTLGIERSTLDRKLKKYGVARPN